MADCYPVAAVRHLIDADLLYAQHRLDNAMCHYAFSAECALKAFAQKRKKIHELYELWDLVCAYTELLGLLHPQYALLVGTGTPPTALVKDHPERRYGPDIDYTNSEMQQAQEFSHLLVQRIIDAVLNGQIG